MYLPEAFRQPDSAAIESLIRDNPLATLVVPGSEGLEASSVPLLYFAGENAVIGHVAKPNPIALHSGAPALAIFQGPQHYISPNWYVSKQEHGRVVPTWNYTTVHVHGTLTIHEDAGRILRAVTLLTDRMEAGQPKPWRVSDAPAEYTAALAKAIVGLEIRISRIEAKWKVSQNRPLADRASVRSALNSLGTSQALTMANLIPD